ncbi:MAG: Asp-tRNA(Asn)/Glu-tRNA(Gln) amidotransferase subunit GatB [Saprospiraceae bacterium]|nr:Asp-tRNA(Asn)/Glu-tRNA(Gln) amidotransferase subunit GatB [Saprospiraceae bacterium]
MLEQYEPVIGLEVHIQLATKSKAFCGDSAAYGGAPNSHVGLISLAHPGTLPRPNQSQVEFAIRLGLALDCEINRRSIFDRKHYFYADLPKGFQTTQNAQPICLGGRVIFPAGAENKSIRLHHIHMEEDAGKSLHEEDPHVSLIDLNRAGVPLLEMVTEPDFRSGDEVYFFINELRRLVRYLEISDGNMEEGSLRCDCNISVRKKGENILNPRSEIKNVNSARYARKAIEYEIERQIKLIQSGGTPTQETREFIVDKGITVGLRSKEDANDYRYFPEPDILPIVISDLQIEEIQNSIPSLPSQHRENLGRLNLSPEDIEIIIETRERAENFNHFLSSHPEISAKMAANFFVNKWYPNETDSGYSAITHSHIADFIDLIEKKKISSTMAYQKLWPTLVKEPQDVNYLFKKLNLAQTDDSEALESMAKAVIAANQNQLEKYRKGKKGIITFFMGQLMRKSKGKANPEVARKILEKILDAP